VKVSTMTNLLRARNRRTARLLLAWIAALAVASLLVGYLR
jgi:hypothetical protein